MTTVKRSAVRLMVLVLMAAMLAFSAPVPANAWIPGGTCSHGTVYSGPLNRWIFTRTLANYPIHEHEYDHDVWAYPFWIHQHYESSAPC